MASTLKIVTIQYKGKASRTDEYVEILNEGANIANLEDLHITSVGSPLGRNQLFRFPKGATLAPGQRTRVYTNENPQPGGYSFNSKNPIWNDNGDTAKLMNGSEQLDAYTYPRTEVLLEAPGLDKIGGVFQVGKVRIDSEGRTITLRVANHGTTRIELDPAFEIQPSQYVTVEAWEHKKTLEQSEYADLTLEIAPKVPGSFEIKVSFKHNAGNSPLIGTLLVEGDRPPKAAATITSTLNRNEGSYVFPSLLLGKEETVLFTMQNTGGEDLVCTGLSFGESTNNYVIRKMPAERVAPGATTTFEVTFKPIAGGEHLANLILLHPDATTTQTAIAISGTSSGPDIAVKLGDKELGASNFIISFAEKKVGEAGETLTFVIENEGDADLTLTGKPKISISGDVDGEFTVGGEPETILGAKKTTSFTITFTPKRVGGKIATVSIASDDFDENPYDFTLKAIAKPSRIWGPAKDISLKFSTAMIRRADGTVWYRTQPSRGYSQVPGISKVKAIAGSRFILTEDGVMSYVDFGSGTTKSLLEGVATIAASEDHWIALKEDGTVWTSGDNAFGQLGIGRVGGSSGPNRIPISGTVIDVAATYGCSGVLLADGRVLAWGELYRGSMGWSPYEVSHVRDAIDFAFTQGTNREGGPGQFGVVITRGGGHSAFCADGQVFPFVPGAPAATMVAGHMSWSQFVVTENGQLWSSGTNNMYGLGRGQWGQRDVPAGIVPGLPPIRAVATYGTRTVAIGQDGSVWEWGFLGMGIPQPRCYIQAPMRML